MTTHTQVTRTTVHSRDLDPDIETTKTEAERNIEEEPASGSVLAARVVGYILGIVEILLGLRLLLALLGANRANDFASLLFTVTQPLVQPFFSLFSYTPSYGNSHLELYTLIAGLVYALIAWGLIALIRLPYRDEDM